MYRDSWMSPNCNYAPGMCWSLSFYLQYEYLWMGYGGVIALWIIISTTYGLKMRSKNPDKVYKVKWHIGLLFVNLTTLYWIVPISIGFYCREWLACGELRIALAFVVLSLILTILDLIFSPDAKYFKSSSTTEDQQKWWMKKSWFYALSFFSCSFPQRCVMHWLKVSTK